MRNENRLLEELEKFRLGYSDGTPKTLNQAIENGVRGNNVHYAVKDFLAQKFGAAILMNREIEKIVLELFSTCTK